MISRNGFKIFPIVIEEFLLGNPQVEACAVVGCQSPGGETLPWPILCPLPGRNPNAWKRTCGPWQKKELNMYLIPSAYHFRSALPLTDRGKLDYRALEQEAQQ